MATTTTKLSLIKPDLTDIVDVANLNDNADSIDAAVGFTICTSATRPATPWAGQTIFETDTTSSFVWDGSAWQAAGGGGGSITVSATAPVSPPPGNGDLWWDSDNGNMYIYYEDVDSSQWVAANGPQVFVGAAAPAGYQGQMWFDSSTGKMYVYYDDGTSSQWVSAIGGSLAGTVLQVVSTTKTDTFSASVASGATSAITGLSASITPSSTSSKILILVNVGVAADATGIGRAGVAIHDGTSLIGVGATAGSRTVLASGIASTASGNTNVGTIPSTSFLDSPATTSSITYTIHAVNNNTATQTLYINRSVSDADNASQPRGASTITLMEVAG